MTMIAQSMLPHAYLSGGKVVAMAAPEKIPSTLFFRKLG
jgi:hypothetical protein